MVQFSKCLVSLILIKEHSAHQNAAFNVVGIFGENFLRESFCCAYGFRASPATEDIDISELDPCLKIIRIERRGSLQLGNHLLYTLETFISPCQTPVSGS